MTSSAQAGAANDPGASAWQVFHNTARHPILRARDAWYDIPTPPHQFTELVNKTHMLACYQDELSKQANEETRTFRKTDLEREVKLIGQVRDAISAHITDERAWSKFDTVDIFAQHKDSTYVRTFQTSLLNACDGLFSAARQSLAVPRLSSQLVRAVERLRNIFLLLTDTRAATGS